MPITEFFRQRLAASGYDYPIAVPLFEHLATAAIAVVAVAQRDAFLPPDWPLLLAVVAVMAPMVGDMLRTGTLVPRPLLAAVVIAATTVLMLDPPATEFDFAPLLLMMMVGEVAATSGLAVSLVTAGAALTVPVAFAAFGRLDGSASWYLPAIALGWIIGRLMQTQLRLLHQERAARTIAAEQSADAERQRIAREVHDVIAHSLSVTLLHLTAARRALEQDRDVDEAVDALTDAERLGRQAMADIRRTVGLLGNGPSGSRPEPGIDDVGDLVDDFRRAGLPVRFEIHGDPSGITAATGLGVYRVSQESLANVVKHAPGSDADVRVAIGADAVTVDVRNRLRGAVPPPDRNPGNGLRGMRERVTLLGGDLKAGPDADGWRVHAHMPLPSTTCAFGLVRKTPRLS
ncbi:sensor histidine kinase [Rhodococcus sp. NPDC003318]|uniref:sensor histidine kinase n=1 Tax=Rhodococcus sp. NPDC003318 TaxID=3364503 RepID=UPI0036C2E612